MNLKMLLRMLKLLSVSSLTLILFMVISHYGNMLQVDLTIQEEYGPMNNMQRNILCHIMLAFIFLMVFSECKKKNYLRKPNKETNIFNFLHLVVFRVVYGFASLFGAQESILDFLGGFLVPQGVSDFDDYKDDEGENEDFEY